MESSDTLRSSNWTLVPDASLQPGKNHFEKIVNGKPTVPLGKAWMDETLGF